MNKAFLWIAIGVGVVVVLLALEVAGIHWAKFTGVQREDARREVYEQSQSYAHGKIQDLSKYYIEYNSATATDDDKQGIVAYVNMQFADFDETTIRNPELRQFLITCRGY